MARNYNVAEYLVTLSARSLETKDSIVFLFCFYIYNSTLLFVSLLRSYLFLRMYIVLKKKTLSGPKINDLVLVLLG